MAELHIASAVMSAAVSTHGGAAAVADAHAQELSVFSSLPARASEEFGDFDILGALEDGELDGADDLWAPLTLAPAAGSGQDAPDFASVGNFDDEGTGELLWQERALCAQTDPEAFFPEKGGSTREAKRVCSGCDVRAECLEYALANDERFGIWGGLSERERRRLRRRAG